MDAMPAKKKAKADAAKDAKESKESPSPMQRPARNRSIPRAKDGKDKVVAADTKDAKGKTATPTSVKKKELTADQKKRQFVQKELKTRSSAASTPTNWSPGRKCGCQQQGTAAVKGRTRAASSIRRSRPRSSAANSSRFKPEADPRKPLMDWLRVQVQPVLRQGDRQSRLGDLFQSRNRRAAPMT